MQTIILNLFLISCICVMVTDISNFPFELEERIGKWLGGKVHFKLLECSLCQTWWCGFIYLLCIGELSILTVFLALFMAVNTTLVLSLYHTLKDAVEWVFVKLHP